MKWQTVTLNEISTTQYGFTASAVEDAVGPKFLRITDIVPDSIDWNAVPYCKIDDSLVEKYRLEPGDIVIARTGNTTGYARLIRDDVKAVFASYLVRLKLNRKIAEPAFVGRLMESQVYRSFVESIKGGAAQGNANAKTLTLFRFRLPPISTQEKIADMLSAYDDLIENNRRRIQLLEQSARLLYKEWFVLLRFPGHEHVKVVDGVPKGWEKKMAFDVMEILSGGTPKTVVADYWDGNIPFYTPKDSTDTAYVYETEKTITEVGLKNCSGARYPKDTVFITARGTVGNLNLAQVPMAINQSCYALVAKEPLTQYFLYYSLLAGMEQLRSRASGAVFDAVVKDTFKLIPFLLPSELLIRNFTNEATPVLGQIENLLSQNRKLKQARDLLLSRLMSGEINV